MKKLLWLDDFRNPADYVTGEYDISWVKNYAEFCAFINEHGLPDIICFDHDLGEHDCKYDGKAHYQRYGIVNIGVAQKKIINQQHFCKIDRRKR